MPLAIGNYWEWDCQLESNDDKKKVLCSFEIIAEQNGKYTGRLVSDKDTTSIKLFATTTGIRTDTTYFLANETRTFNLNETSRFFTNPNRLFFNGPVFAIISGDSCKMSWSGTGNIFGSYHTIEMEDIYLEGIGCVRMHYESSFFGSVMGFLVAGSSKYERRLKRAIIDGEEIVLDESKVML
jgi:hypothetical protein